MQWKQTGYLKVLEYDEANHFIDLLFEYYVKQHHTQLHIDNLYCS